MDRGSGPPVPEVPGAAGAMGMPQAQTHRRTRCPPPRAGQSAYWLAAWMIGRQRATSSARNRRW
jgi:hypothetical protein